MSALMSSALPLAHTARFRPPHGMASVAVFKPGTWDDKFAPIYEHLRGKQSEKEFAYLVSLLSRSIMQGKLLPLVDCTMPMTVLDIMIDSMRKDMDWPIRPSLVPFLKLPESECLQMAAAWPEAPPLAYMADSQGYS